MTKQEIQVQYDKNLNMLHKLSHQCASRCGRPEKDVFGEACFWFMKATKTYDPSRGSFGTYMYRVISNQLILWAKKMDLPPDPDMYMEQATTLSPDKALAFKDWVASLSKECQVVIMIILNGPAEILEIGTGGNEKRLFANIKNYLRENGWSWPTIWDTMKTLKKEVRAL